MKEVKPSLPSSGKYTFTNTVEVHNEAKLSSPVQFEFKKGESVNYDKALVADDYSWISYVSYSGIRRYVALNKVGQDTPKAEATASKPSVVTGNIKVENVTAKGFDVVVSNVSDTQGVKAVKVPVWSSQGGQDDIIWYDATKQNSGDYKVAVKISDHKNNTGEYNAHLYYVQNDGSLKGIAATRTTVAGESTTETTSNKVTSNGSYYSIKGKYDDIIIANKKYPLSPSYNPGEDATAKAAFVRLRNDMINQGFNVGHAYSGFRSYDTQKTLYQNYANRDGHAAADRYSARAGYSEHQTGLAYDLTDRSGNLLEDKTATDWLNNNAYKYGFVVRYQPGKESVTGYMPEAWHIRYIGKEAKEVYESGKSLEEYFDFDGGDYTNTTSSSTANTSTTTSLTQRGTYHFTSRSSIKAEPKVSSPELAYYDAGNSVNYDKVLTADGHQWISYIGYDYERYYADIAALKPENTSSTTEATRDETIPERGTYYFTKPADVKNQPSLTAKTEFNFDPGMSVNYDRSLLADNHRWISYVSYSGTRRYVDLGAVAEALAKPKGAISIESHDNGDFSVVISNVADQNGVLGVSVPIWSEKNGQDDIIWYNATRLNNGNYKVNVSLSDHKNERGLYNVHLYYVETNGKLVGVGGTTYTVPAEVEETHTTTSYNLPDSGTYTFKERSSIKAEPRVASPELAYYDAGMSVNYDKIVSGDGYQWLSYLSYNGNRRYVAVAKLAQQESKPSGTINIENLSNLGFDVHITNVSGGDKAIQGVSVPVWTAKDGQDDLVWHQADRQSDGSYKVRINVSDHKAEAGEYIVHLYYVQDGKMVGIGGTSTTVPVQNATRHNLPASGSYTFTARTGIKTQPLVANPDVSYYDTGMSVNYDKVVNNDGYTWISYLSYSGHRFYVAVAPTSVTKPVELPVQPSTPSSGTYTFKERSSIKAEPSVASPELAYYDAGMSVNYDRLVTADGHQWLSYVSRGGNRRYIAIDGKATAVAQPASPSLAATGTYTFTKPSSIKAQPSVASPELAYYDKGMSVRYDKVLTADGHTWLSYVTYSGARRYVDIA